MKSGARISLTQDFLPSRGMKNMALRMGLDKGGPILTFDGTGGL
jgi:hypothetical protein